MELSEVRYKNKCCVPGCLDRGSKRHRFPKDDAEVMAKWVKNINEPKLKDLSALQIYRTHYVCNRHFADEYLVPGTKRGLRKDAIPTLSLPVPVEEIVEARGGKESTDNPEKTTTSQVMDAVLHVPKVHPEAATSSMEVDLIPSTSGGDIFYKSPHYENQDVLQRSNPLVCQKHFTPDDIDQQRRKRLKCYAVPSIFESLETAETSTPYIPTVNALRKEDFSEICRFCLSRGNWLNIFDLKIAEIPLSGILSQILCHDIYLDDEMPKNICEACTKKITEFYTFKRGCEESQVILQSLLSTDSDSIEEPLTKMKYDDYCDGNTVEDIQIKSWDVQNAGLIIDKDHTYNIIIKEIESNDTENSSLTEMDGNNSEEEHNLTNDEFASNFDVSTLHSKNKIKTIPSRSKIYVCSCKKIFVALSEYVKHRKDLPRCRPVEICKICHKVFNRHDLKRHMRIHIKKPFVPSIQSVSLKAQFPSHSRDITRSPRKPKQFLTQDSGVSTVCKICNKVYSSRSTLAFHLHTHGKKNFLCSECGKSFHTKSALLCHNRTHTGEKPFCCHLCSRLFSNQSSFSNHLKIHTGQKSYVCEVCGKRFTQSSHLKSHLRVHSKEKPFSCSYCSRSFSHRASLRVHVRIHTGETPYVCALCSKGFYDATSLKKHLKRHEGDEKKDKIEGRCVE